MTNGRIGSTSSISLQAYDRNANANADVSCNIERMDVNGNPLHTVNFKTSAGGPGTGLQNISGSTSGSPIDASAWRLRCTLPAVASSGWFSHVVSYQMNTNQ